MNKQTFRHTALPLIAAFIWGTAFTAQKLCTTGAFFFNAGRSVIAIPFLMVLILVVNKGDVKHMLKEDKKKDTRVLWIGGISCGAALAVASCLQQLCMNLGTESGKCAFLTAIYMIFTPILLLILYRKKTTVRVWIAAVVALVGLFFLCVTKDFSLRASDLLGLACALFYAIQIVLIDKFTESADPIKLSCIQFMVCAVVSAVASLIFEEIEVVQAIKENILPLLYLGIFSSGIAYTLQMVSQKGGNATIVSILFAMESVFGVIAGAVVLQERMAVREYIGCVIVMIAVILTQLPERSGKSEKSAAKA